MRCCTDGDSAAPAIPSPSSSSPPSRSWVRRIVALTEWVLPVATLALIPKCPGCVAAYVLLLTGIGISFSAAEATQWTLIALSVVLLAYLTIRTARRAFTRFA